MFVISLVTSHRQMFYSCYWSEVSWCSRS